MDVLVSSIYFLLILFKFLETNRNTDLDLPEVGHSSVRSARRFMPTFFVVVRDGSLYFLVILGELTFDHGL